MTEPKDTDLQRYLDGDSPLSRRYRQASVESAPSEMDDAILKAARDAVPARLRRRSSRWAVPLALAATMLLGVNVVWLLRDDAVPQPPRRGAAQKAEAARPAAAEADQQVDAASAPATRPVPAAVPDLADRAAAAPAPEQAPPPAAAAQLEEREETSAGSPPVREKKATGSAESAADADTEADAETWREQPKLERQALRSRRAEPSNAAPTALRADAPAAHDDSGGIERVTQSLAALLRAGDLAGVRARYGAFAIGDARLQQVGDILENGELRPRSGRDGIWQVECVGPEDEVLCRLHLAKTDDGWRLVDATVP